MGKMVNSYWNDNNLYEGETPMFWNSVISGFKMLTYWETYVAGLEYVAIFFIPYIIGALIEKKTTGETGGQGGSCLMMPLFMVFQSAATAVMILTLAPIILGLGEDAAWKLPWTFMVMAPGILFKLVGCLIVALIVIVLASFLPIVGPILIKVKSFEMLVYGVIILAFYLDAFHSVDHRIPSSGQVSLIPDFWFSVGLIVIGGIMSFIGMMAAGLAAVPLERAREGIGKTIALPIVFTFGFIPVFMYGAWLGAQLRGRF